MLLADLHAARSLAFRAVHQQRDLDPEAKDRFFDLRRSQKHSQLSEDNRWQFDPVLENFR